MKSFMREFLRDGPAGTGARNVFLAVFGKHPGWADHIDDIGIETESLARTRQLLYTQGIGRNLDSGAWDKLGEDSRLPGFDHVFAWVRGEQAIIGKMWDSRDGKGRTRYPMIACAHCTGLAWRRAFQLLRPEFDAFQNACIAAGSSGEVRELRAQQLARMRELVLGAPAGGPDGSMAAPGGDELAGILAQAWRSLGECTRTSFWQTQAPAAQSVRLPAHPASAEQALEFWLEMVFHQPGFDAPVLAFASPAGKWVDLVAGEPDPNCIFALRANLRCKPFSFRPDTEVDARFREEARGALRAVFE